MPPATPALRDAGTAEADEGAAPAPVGGRARRILLAVVLLALCYAYWRLLHRWFFLQRDDFWLVSITEDPAGRFDLGEFLWRWWHDWTERNGRSSDAAVRAMLRPGVDAVGWIAPAVLTACSAAAWRWLPRGRGLRPGVAVAAPLLLLTVIPVALLTEQSISGSTVFWAAGMGNYVLPTGLAVLAASWWVRPPTSPGALLLAVLTLLATSLLHEMAALTVFAVTHVWWFLNRRRVGRRDAVLIAAAYLGVLIAFAGPGRWRRLDDLVGEESGPGAWLSAAARFTSELLLRTGPVWLVVLGVLALAVGASWRESSAGRRRALAGGLVLTGTAGVVAWLTARTWRSGSERCSAVAPFAGDGADALPALLTLGSAALSVLACAVLLVLLRPTLGDAPLLLGTGALATLPIPMLTGLCASRVWYPPLVWVLTLAGVVAVTLVVRDRMHARVLLALTLIGLIAAGAFLRVAEPAVRANHDSFESVLTQIPATREQGSGTVLFPEEVPHPDFGRAPVYRLPSIACGFRTYYAVPDAVVLDDGGAPASGLPEYCPRPDDPRAP